MLLNDIKQDFNLIPISLVAIMTCLIVRCFIYFLKPKHSATDKVIHPNSRIAAQLGKQKHRDERINR